jgi:hypothetical protein
VEHFLNVKLILLIGIHMWDLQEFIQFFYENCWFLESFKITGMFKVALNYYEIFNNSEPIVLWSCNSWLLTKSKTHYVTLVSTLYPSIHSTYLDKVPWSRYLWKAFSEIYKKEVRRKLAGYLRWENYSTRIHTV